MCVYVCMYVYIYIYSCYISRARRVLDRLGVPLSDELRVVHHGRLPLAVVLVVPVVGLGGIRVGNLRRIRQ